MSDNIDNTFAPDFKSFLNDILKHWMLFAVTLTSGIVIAGLYLKFASEKFQVSSTIVLNLNEKNQQRQTSSGVDVIELESLMNDNKSFQNELFVLGSTPLIQEVVDKMDVLVSYYIQEDNIPKEIEFTLTDIYKNSPFIVLPDNQHIQPINTLIYISIVNDNEFQINCQSNEAELFDLATRSRITQDATISLRGKFRFGEDIVSDHYSFKLLLNSNYKKELYDGKDLFFTINNKYELAEIFKSGLEVKQNSLESTLVSVNLGTDNVTKGIDFLNNLISTYIEKNLAVKNFLATQTIEYIDNQLSSLSDSLGNSERQLQFLRSNASVMNIDEKAGNIYSQLATLTNQRNEIERRMSYLIQMDSYFGNNKDSAKILAPNALGLNDPLLNNLITELTALNAEKSDIISKNQLLNPRLQTINVSIENLKDVITEHIRFSIVSTEGELNEATKRIDELNVEFARLPGTQRQLLGIERKFNLTDELYTSLLEKRIQAQIIKSSNLPDCEIIEPPHFEAITSPNKFIILFLAVVIGILIPLSYILGRRIFTDTVYDTNDINRISKLPHLGFIPENPLSINNVVYNNPTHFVAEAFQTVRSNLIYYLQGKKKSIILVTSSLPGEGKSFTAINLASSFAINNNSTILIEFDLRRPSSVLNELSLNKEHGLSSYLIDSAKLKDIILKTNVPGFDLIRAGQIPPNPLALISSDRVSVLLSELEKSYDYIILDTPPYGLVSDSGLLMRYADVKIFMARINYLTKKAFSNSIQSITGKGIENVYLLINDISEQENAYSKYDYSSGKKQKSWMKLLIEKIKSDSKKKILKNAKTLL